MSHVSQFIRAAAVACVALASTAEAQQPLRVQRLGGAVSIDGDPGDAAWKDIPLLPMTMYTPVFRGTPTQRTEMRVAYDDENLYIAAWCYDTNPDGIRVNSLYRDRWSGDDAIAIYVDAFNDKRSSKWFGVTASGVRFDQLVSDDGATLNGSWDTFWYAATTITSEGWFAEVRIPFSSLGFRVDSAGGATMGLTTTRLVSRIEERVTFPEIDPKFEFRRPSVAHPISLDGVRTRTPVYVTPYLLGGMQQSAIEPTPGTFRTNDTKSREAGLDIRYPVSGNLTLDVTINTDFAQVEADDQQVNLDRFPLFFPERRRFFQEGSGIFDFTVGGGTRLFHSRRIGITSDGQTVPVTGGARLVGRIGAWDSGILAMSTDDRGRPTENFGVLRLRRSVIDPLSSAGMMVTAYESEGRTNVGLGTDASIHVTGEHYFGAKYLVTTDNADAVSTSMWNSGLIDVRWERRTQRGLQFNVNSTHSGRDFRPELGFQQRRDFTTANAVANWFIYTDSSRYFRRYYPGALVLTTYRNEDKVLESAQYAVWVQWDTKAGGGGWIEPKAFHENVRQSFQIGDAVIPAGSYDFADLQVVYYMPTGNRIRTSVDARAGTYFDGTRAQVIASPTWNVSPHLELGADYQHTRLRFSDRNQKEDIHVARVRIRAAANARISGNAFVQYNSTAGRADLNFRFRYAFAEGTDLWLVYNEGIDTELTEPLPGVRSPRSLARTLILKYTHTFAF